MNKVNSIHPNDVDLGINFGLVQKSRSLIVIGNKKAKMKKRGEYLRNYNIASKKVTQK